jgi:hypothetical protein
LAQRQFLASAIRRLEEIIMRKFEPELKRWFVDWLAALVLCAIAYVVSHLCFRSEAALISDGLAIGSGGVWAMSAHLPPRCHRLVAELNFGAACLAAMSAVCLLS